MGKDFNRFRSRRPQAAQAAKFLMRTTFVFRQHPAASLRDTDPNPFYELPCRKADQSSGD